MEYKNAGDSNLIRETGLFSTLTLHLHQEKVIGVTSEEPGGHSYAW